MTTTKLFSAAVLVMMGLSACNNSAKETAKTDATNLSNYVDSVDKMEPVYTIERWSDIDSGYQQRAMQAEKSMGEMEAADKASAEASKQKYAALKATYETKMKAKEAAAATEAARPDFRKSLRDKLFGEGKIGSDMKFEYVTGNNILGVYKNFVNTVSDNKKNYSREDWDEIKVLYEALDTRKNAVEKDLASGDNLKIAGQKIRFASILDTHRAFSKVSENEDAKK